MIILYHRVYIFLSTLPARGATEGDGCRGGACAISIHAPREGSDPAGSPLLALLVISIHAPREGSDLVWS